MSKPVGNSLDFLGSSRALNLPSPASDTEPARLLDLKNAIEGLKQKDPVAVATQGNLNLASPGNVIDTIDLSTSVVKRVLVKANTLPEQNGIYFWNGAAVPMTRAVDASSVGELNGALVPVNGGTNAGTNWRQTATLVTLGTDAVNWAVFGTASPPASATTPGLIEIATQAEVNAGTNGTLAVTPETLAGYTGFTRKVFAQIGDGSATAFPISHNLNTENLVVRVKHNTTKKEWIVDNENTSLNVVTVTFEAGLPPGLNEFTVTIIG